MNLGGAAMERLCFFVDFLNRRKADFVDIFVCGK